ncbi:hypothetical protein Tco_1067672 [Tanacetum coccineum]|uniref:Uncharacterized protein n=1 Tax=Tanacetum coccineum TaxID=301880 RepID=A0ABQ5HDI8_9ASTR
MTTSHSDSRLLVSCHLEGKTHRTCIHAFMPCFLSHEEPTEFLKLLVIPRWVGGQCKGYSYSSSYKNGKVFYVDLPKGHRAILMTSSWIYQEGALWKSFEKLMKDKFSDDSHGNLPSFGGFQSMKGTLKILQHLDQICMFADSPLELVAYTDSDYAGATLDRKSTTGGCQFLGNRLISWQCKKQTVVATSTTEAEYVAAASCCGQLILLTKGFDAEQTAPGKELSNPLTVDSLLKTIWSSIAPCYYNEALASPEQTATAMASPRQTANGQEVDLFPNMLDAAESSPSPSKITSSPSPTPSSSPTPAPSPTPPSPPHPSPSQHSPPQPGTEYPPPTPHDSPLHAVHSHGREEGNKGWNSRRQFPFLFFQDTEVVNMILPNRVGRRSAEKRKDKGKGIMTEEEPKKKSKKEIEQERLSYAEALRLEEQMNEEQRAQIARDAEIARQWEEEEKKKAMDEKKKVPYRLKVIRTSNQEGRRSILEKQQGKRQKLESKMRKKNFKTFLDIVPREEVPITLNLYQQVSLLYIGNKCVTETYMYYQLLQRLCKAQEKYNILINCFRILTEWIRATIHVRMNEILEKTNMNTIFELRLHEICGIHIIVDEQWTAIHMLTEKEVSLESRDVVKDCLSTKLEVDHGKFSNAFELLRF